MSKKRKTEFTKNDILEKSQGKKMIENSERSIFHLWKHCQKMSDHYLSDPKKLTRENEPLGKTSVGRNLWYPQFLREKRPPRTCCFCHQPLESKLARRWHKDCNELCYTTQGGGYLGPMYAAWHRHIVEISGEHDYAYCYVHFAKGEVYHSAGDVVLHEYPEPPCDWCGDTTQIEVDHALAIKVAHRYMTPLALFHAYRPSNLRYLCRKCHAGKTGLDRRLMNLLDELWRCGGYAHMVDFVPFSSIYAVSNYGAPLETRSLIDGKFETDSFHWNLRVAELLRTLGPKVCESELGLDSF